MGIIGTKRRGRIVVGAAGAIIGAIYLIMAFQLSMGRPAAPGPGVFPVVVGIFLIVASIGMILEAVVSSALEGDIEFPRGPALKRLAIFVGGTLAFIVLLPVLGLFLSAALYILLVIKALGRKGWLVPLIASAALSAIVAVSFVILLKVPLSILPPALHLL
ncbi:hypothetical protein GCM10025768_02830 [Microbacterium pseudoresistens]|uniref:Putative membrane protein n=1 Tax=Microbacterium pseudoresistens TaxID=640634 RepID=A0A7Y9EUC2_9MICO|nr:putative membrane protein [Microbacterium pseudoresistens]